MMCFVFDQSFVNLYILYLEKMTLLNLRSLEYVRFRLGLAHYLVATCFDKEGAPCPKGGRRLRVHPAFRSVVNLYLTNYGQKKVQK
jgi:hypothetical protein